MVWERPPSLNLIAGILEVQSGRIVLDGEEENTGARELYVAKGSPLGAQDGGGSNIILPLVQLMDKGDDHCPRG